MTIDRELVTRKLLHEDLDQEKVFDALEDALRDVPVFLERLNTFVKSASDHSA